MKVRHIFWYRKESELLNHVYVLQMSPDISKVSWYSCSFFKIRQGRSVKYRSVDSREEFEKYYLEWKAQNEG